MKSLDRKTLEALIEKAMREKAYVQRDDRVRCIVCHVVPHLADLFEQVHDFFGDTSTDLVSGEDAA